MTQIKAAAHAEPKIATLRTQNDQKIFGTKGRRMTHLNRTHLSRRTALLAGSVAMVLAVSSAQAAGDKARGAKLAGQWCNSCHTVSARDASRKFNAGPEFLDLAKKSESYLATAIDKPHDFMPKFPTLSRRDKENLVAHIRSLE